MAEQTTNPADILKDGALPVSSFSAAIKSLTESAGSAASQMASLSAKTLGSIPQNVKQMTRALGDQVNMTQRAPGPFGGFIYPYGEPAYVDAVKNLKLGQALIANADVQRQAAQVQAARNVGVLQGLGSTTGEQLGRIQSTYQGLEGKGKPAEAEWDATVKAAQDMVARAKAGYSEMKATVLSSAQRALSGLDVTKAGDLQTATYATMGKFKEIEQTVNQVYGAGSAESRVIQAQKRMELSDVLKSVSSIYAKARTEIETSLMTVLPTAMAQGLQYVGYNEQNLLDVMKAANTAKAAYTLEVTQAKVALEQLAGSIYENALGWITNIPIPTMDYSGLLATLAELVPNPEEMPIKMESLRA